jgi:hypothetical protein
MNKIISVVIALLIILSAISCEQEKNNGAMGSSHNAGKNCISCHSNFKLAGSVYNKSFTKIYSGVKIKVTTQSNGQGSVLVTMNSDNSGNFYTGTSISFGSGVFVSAENTSGTVQYMNTSITSGACNSCHGSSTSKMWAE